MSIPLALFKFAARAGLNAVGFGVAGDFAVEVLPSVCRDVWQWWGKGRPEIDLRAEVQEVGQLSEGEAARAARQAVKEEAASAPPEVQLKLEGFLQQWPAAVRQSQRRPADPSGRTVAATFHLRKADDLLPLFPSRLPRFRAGDRAPGFPDWTLQELLGVGGFGEVWKATNPHLPPVALKFCLDTSAARTLRNEAALLGRVVTQGRHPGIVQLLDTALASDPPCLKYEFVAGGDLAGLIQQWHQGRTVGSDQAALTEQATRLMHDLAQIVSFAHKLDPPIVHRDLKPANILLQPGPQGIVHLRVADFGIGGVAIRRAAEEHRTATTRGQFLTSALRGSCTPLYASPQQLRGEDPDPRDDVYALGVIWLQLLNGDLTTGAAADWRDELEERKVPEDAIKLLGACLAGRPEKRPADAGVLAEALSALLNGKPLVHVALTTTGAPAPASDPSSVQIKEVQVLPFVVDVPARPASQVELPGLPPVPQDILEAEGRIEALERAIEQLESDSHPSLTQGRQAVREVEHQYESLRADLEAHRPELPAEQQKALADAVARDPRGTVAPLLDFAPEASTRVLLPFIHRLRNVERARLALESARKQLEVLRQQEVASLRRQREEMVARLSGRQEEDLLEVLRAFFRKAGDDEEFPLEAFMELEPLLEQRRCRLSPRQVLTKAEQAFETWKTFGEVALPREVTNSVGMKFVLIPAGKFRMGSPAEEKGRRADEGPVHEVTLTHPFYLAVFPVTQEQYQGVMGSNPSYFSRSGEGRDKVLGLDTRSFPVEAVSWEAAAGFCRRLAELPGEKKAGRAYRLPSEAEWEYACRAGTTTPYYTGDSLSSTQANFNGLNPGGAGGRGPVLQRPCPVGWFPPNAWGLHDMLGNVWEWCHDWYGERAYPSQPVTDPRGPATGTSHVMRGGAWDVGGDLCRCATRNVFRPGWDRCFGFRVVLVLNPRPA